MIIISKKNWWSALNTDFSLDDFNFRFENIAVASVPSSFTSINLQISYLVQIFQINHISLRQKNLSFLVLKSIELSFKSSLNFSNQSSTLTGLACKQLEVAFLKFDSLKSASYC